MEQGKRKVDVLVGMAERQIQTIDDKLLGVGGRAIAELYCGPLINTMQALVAEYEKEVEAATTALTDLQNKVYERKAKNG